MSEDEYHIPNDDAVSADDIRPGADLKEADLSEADLRGADLSEADLNGADLQANLRAADLSGSVLVNAILTDVVLWDTTLSGTLLSRGTDFDPPGQRIKQYAENGDVLSSSVDRYDAIARANHELRTAYSENGLLKQARDARVRERKARRNEARAEGGRSGTGAFLLSCLSQVFTGYGVQLLPVLLVMSVLFLGSAAVYTLWGGMPVDESLYYSVVTFTTSPPETPSEVGFGLVATLVAGFETFAGTTAIIFLGYVLGTRERV